MFLMWEFLIDDDESLVFLRLFKRGIYLLILVILIATNCPVEITQKLIRDQLERVHLLFFLA